MEKGFGVILGKAVCGNYACLSVRDVGEGVWRDCQRLFASQLACSGEESVWRLVSWV